MLATERRYDLKIQNITANITGVSVSHALGIAQAFPIERKASIPAPTLRFNLGDEAIIKVTNETNEPTTLHWHGILVPWQQDGPQFSNTKIIGPNASHTFRFPIRHTGTYWYHSHTELQEQRGLYGAIVIEEDQPIEKVEHEYVFVMSDWTNELPKAVLYNLKKDGDYYGLKKNFFPSLWKAITAGVLGDYLRSEWQRMGPMDLSDVGYDAFLINGKIKSTFENVRHGEKIRFRIINASASTYFHFNIGNHRSFKIITKDGMPVRPVHVNELLIGIAETYDVIFELPHEMKMFEAKATANDFTGSASLTFGMGDLEVVPKKATRSPYGMRHGKMNHESGHEGDHNGDGPQDTGHGDHGDGHSGHTMGTVESEGNQLVPSSVGRTKRLQYEMLKSVGTTHFDENLVRAQVIDLELSGDMERYTWHINGKPFSEKKYIEIRENEIITFRYINKTMMHHPMHLHGHFFRVLNGQGDYAPLFHTVDVAPMKTVMVEFHANEPGIWFLHCHNLYHMKMGMARLVKYEGFEPTEELKEDFIKWGPKMTKDDDAFWRSEANFYSNIAKVEVGINAGRYEVEMELEVDEYDP